MLKGRLYRVIYHQVYLFTKATCKRKFRYSRPPREGVRRLDRVQKLELFAYRRTAFAFQLSAAEGIMIRWVGYHES